LGNSREQNRGDFIIMRTEQNPHKGMTPPSIQNLKALGLWVFFLICCSNFSFLFDVGFRLTWIPNNLPRKWEFLPHWYTPPRAEAFSNTSTLITKENSVRKNFDTESNCTRPSRKPSALIPLVGKFERTKLGRSHNNENWVKPIQENDTTFNPKP